MAVMCGRAYTYTLLSGGRMGRSKRQSSQKSRLTRYRHTSANVTLGIFKRGSKTNHAVRDGPFTYEFYHSVLENTRAFDLLHRDFIYAYQVIVFAVDLDSGAEFSFTVQNLRAPRYRQNDAERFAIYEEKAEDILNKSSTNFEIRFMRIVLVSEKSEKQKLDIIREERSKNQAEGKAASKREKELQAHERELARVRREREKNRMLRELGMLKPAPKKAHKLKKKVWL